MKRKNKRKIIFLSTLALCIALGFAFQTKETIMIKKVEAMSQGSWGLSFQEAGKSPVIDVNKEELEQLEGYYLGDEENKKIYLTFDAGFENGNTEKILDALKKEGVKACFFLVGNYMEKEPELVKRMVAEGHIVGNHTYHHKDMDSINQKEEFLKELTDLETLYRQITGEEMKKFYRPPQGKYSLDQLNWAKESGYKTIFWSLAYVDWEVDKQPSKEEAISKLCERIHPGSIILLHSTSTTNGEIMEEIIKEWKNMGYTFGTLEEL